MNAPFKQAERLGRLTTALGPDVLGLLRFDGSDYLNDLFEYRVEALAARDDLDFDALVGTHATVEIEAHDRMRPFDGIVTQVRWAGVGENGHRYDLTLRPWFWLAGRRRNQRIFHDRTVVEILQELLADYAGLGAPAVQFLLSRDYPQLEYTVQYRESDLDFARRQMERAGISFHFRHAPGSHTLVLTDDVLAHDDVGARPFKRYDGHHQYEQEHFWEWAPERNLTTGGVRLIDYNFKKPHQSMEANFLGDAVHPQGQIESFDYPGDYLAQDVGKLVAGLRTDQERGADRRNRAVGDCVSLGSGMRVALAGDRVPGLGETYLCLSASHHFVSEAYGSGGQGSDGYSFAGSYVLMPDTAPMAPPRRTAAALVQGPQTAMVVGEGEIDCDEYGRILVKFHWDLANAYSMRCRVSQNWAGGGWGGMVIPRIGMEVLVEFLEGDPDKPVVVGNVFNGMNDAPYPLPENKTKMVMRSQTHQGSGFNELSFEDQSGREEIYMHGQKDHRVTILNDQNQNIGHDRSKTIGNDQTETVGNNKTITVGSNHTETISANKTLSVGGNHSETVTGNMSVSVTQNRSESVSGARTLSVTGNDSTTVSKGNHALTVDTGSQTTTVKTGERRVSVLAAGQYTTVKQDIITVSEAGAVSIKAATGIVLEAPSILLKADANNFIQVSKGQVIIEGAETYVNPRETAPDTSGSAPSGGGPQAVAVE
ncbi:type VI secretion system Vgr family protein [Paracoccus sp. S1E-3]|uniref:type VI secretion system Vgr family protein n=1 Tax=Paracoccus sp. S1E-3 TaxID=2756130 RepID=UPI0021051151|nr:type VI secretion system tip protein TssI/VgrG [Paracoccus sp. S1E-3]